MEVIREETARWVTRESRQWMESTTLDTIRNAGESSLQELLARLDARHRDILRDAIEQYGRVQNIPESIWTTIREDIEEETAALLLLLIMNGDLWTTERLAQSGVRFSTPDMAGYSLAAGRRAMTMAAQTVDTLRDRLARKIEDAAISGPGATGQLTRDGIEQALDETFTQQRRETIAVDQTTGGLSAGQRGAKERIGGDGASTKAGQSVDIELYWVTERDDRVCFPAGTLVETEHGPLPIQKLKCGMLVWTRDGLKPIVGVMRRRYGGVMTTVFADDRAITCTADHPVWTLEKEWVPASQLNPGLTLHSFDHQIRKVGGVFNFSLTDSHNTPTVRLEETGFAGVACGVTVPIDAIDFDCNTPLGDSKVNRVATDTVLLSSGNSNRCQCNAHLGFRRGFGFRAAVARQAAKLFVSRPGALAKTLVACLAVNPYRRAATLLRAVMPSVFLVSKKPLPAPFAVNVLRVGRAALSATHDVPVSISSVHRELSDTHRACLSNRRGIFESAISRAALITTRQSARGGQIETNATYWARSVYAGALSFGRRALQFLETERHSQLCHSWTDVYDIQVAEMPEFFANGILVHNCPRCAPLHDKPESVWGQVFPDGPGPQVHPNCRCSLRTVVVVQQAVEESEGHWVTLDNGVRVKLDNNGSIADEMAALGKDESKDKSDSKAIARPERQAIEDYSTDEFQDINAALRTGKATPGLKSKVANIDAYLAKAPKRPGATARTFDIPEGAEGERIRQMLQPDFVFTDLAYASTKKRPDQSEIYSFRNKSPLKGQVILRVDGKSGVDISDISLNPGEGEVLYPRGTRFRVKKAIHANGGIVAEIEEV